jgi:Uma2 family endonuclease
MSPATTALLTAEEFFDLPDPGDGSKQELFRGEVVTMPGPGIRHGEVQLQVGFLLKSFLKSNPIGRAMTESGAVTERDPDTVRGPDVSFYSAERFPRSARRLWRTTPRCRTCASRWCRRRTRCGS